MLAENMRITLTIFFQNPASRIQAETAYLFPDRREQEKRTLRRQSRTGCYLRVNLLSV